MRIVRLQGGLGNQMFQYAFYRYLKHRGFNVILDASAKTLNTHNGFELLRIFPYIRIDNKIDSYFVKRIKHIILSNLQRWKFNFIAGDKNADVRTRTFSERLYSGCWQQHGYLDEMRSELLKDFTFIDIVDEENKKMAEIIQDCNSVSIHVRRGDYYSNKEYCKRMGGICTVHYYNRALEIIKEKVENPVFFVFSDDIAWVRQNIPLQNACFIDCNKGADNFRDMQLMSLCKHNIIANSSFSWFGAWLNRNPEKTIVTPNKWVNDECQNDYLIPDKWLRT